jgi:hypothetical protein
MLLVPGVRSVYGTGVQLAGRMMTARGRFASKVADDAAFEGEPLERGAGRQLGRVQAYKVLTKGQLEEQYPLNPDRRLSLQEYLDKINHERPKMLDEALESVIPVEDVPAMTTKTEEALKTLRRQRFPVTVLPEYHSEAGRRAIEVRKNRIKVERQRAVAAEEKERRRLRRKQDGEIDMAEEDEKSETQTMAEVDAQQKRRAHLEKLSKERGIPLVGGQMGAQHTTFKSPLWQFFEKEQVIPDQSSKTAMTAYGNLVV